MTYQRLKICSEKLFQQKCHKKYRNQFTWEANKLINSKPTKKNSKDLDLIFNNAFSFVWKIVWI
jgi:hypothetical protein